VKRLVVFSVIVAALVGCTKIDYVGNSFPATSHVDVYFSLDDVKRDYTVMGHMTAVADDFVSAEKMQEDMLEKAREKGADGLVIHGLEYYSTGGKTTYTETHKKDEDRETVTGVTSTSTEEKKEIKGTLIKYK